VKRPCVQIFIASFINILCSSLLLVSLLACSSTLNLSNYRADADRYCKVHAIAYWEQTGKLEALNKANPTVKANILSQAFRNSVKSPEMKTLIFDESKNLSIREFYPFLQKRIPELTQQPFNCPAIEDFYLGK
jgi:hypothetical protein